jgi:signal transduction histidine kinase
LYSEITDDVLKGVSQDAEHYAMLHELNLRSAIIVPLVAGGDILGALTLVTESGRHYVASDVAFAEDVARHIAHAIQNARLYSSARHAIQARDEVLRVVSHDLRNPVGNIQVTAKILRSQTLLPDKRDDMVDIITRAADRMNRLIDDLVALARVREGQPIPVRVQVENPAEMMSEACALFNHQARAKSIRLQCETPPTIPFVRVDRHRVLQVLSNLLDNAVKFTPEAGHISIRCESFQDKVRFAVSDTGPGIEPQHLNHIFDLFWQAKPTAHMGAGFGLTISKAIVEQHGGAIWAESHLGAGTTFFFTLPQASGSEEPVDEELAG